MGRPRVVGRWRARLWALALAAGVLAAPAPAAAWNATGHVLIALLAYDALEPKQQAALVRLLQAHPRLSQDLLPALPPGLAGAARDRWLFALAATWPDLARGQPSFDHGTWHYVNLPLSLRHGQLVDCREARRDYPASVRRSAELDAARRAQGSPVAPGGDSIREALPNNVRSLLDVHAPAAERALALSWVMHLVGDAHQPLHAIALFTRDRFQSGDRGGNDILVRERGPLHRVWDELLGLELTPELVASSLQQLPRSAPKRERLPSDVLGWIDGWLDEDCAIGRAAVYAPSVLRAVERFEADSVSGAPAAPAEAAATPPSAASNLGPPKPELALPARYLDHARQTARERARLAGARLGSVLASVRL